MTLEPNKIGTVISVSASTMRCLLLPETLSSIEYTARIGALIKVRTPLSVAYGIVGRLDTEVSGDGSDRHIAYVDFLGESMVSAGNDGLFRRGVSIHPTLGAQVIGTDGTDISHVYAADSTSALRIGLVHQDQTTPAYILPDEMLGKHFAILGSTGAGKSCSVALLLRTLMSKNPNAHVVLLDPHAEYARAFGDLAEVTDMNSLSLPCWLLNFEEAAAVMIVAGTAADREAQAVILREVIVMAKRKFVGESEDGPPITVDTPSPYRIGDLIRFLDNAMGKLDKADNSAPFLRLKSRIESLNTDRRFSFMFPGLLVRDTMSSILSRLLRIPVAGKPVTILDLSGVPSEVVEVVVSVLCRAIFEFALWHDKTRSLPVLLVCEEAHRYVPARDDMGFRSSKLALQRIAKEGRKYGVSLCLVSQRPSELDPGIFSQCGTVFALRLGNRNDQDFVRRVLPESAQGLLMALSSLRQQEVVVVGEGVTVPMRIRLDDLDEALRPRSSTAKFCASWQEDTEGLPLIENTIVRWRTQRH